MVGVWGTVIQLQATVVIGSGLMEDAVEKVLLQHCKISGACDGLEKKLEAAPMEGKHGDFIRDDDVVADGRGQRMVMELLKGGGGKPGEMLLFGQVGIFEAC